MSSVKRISSGLIEKELFKALIVFLKIKGFCVGGEGHDLIYAW